MNCHKFISSWKKSERKIKDVHYHGILSMHASANLMKNVKGENVPIIHESILNFNLKPVWTCVNLKSCIYFGNLNHLMKIDFHIEFLYTNITATTEPNFAKLNFALFHYLIPPLAHLWQKSLRRSSLNAAGNFPTDPTHPAAHCCEWNNKAAIDPLASIFNGRCKNEVKSAGCAPAADAELAAGSVSRRLVSVVVVVVVQNRNRPRKEWESEEGRKRRGVVGSVCVAFSKGPSPKSRANKCILSLSLSLYPSPFFSLSSSAPSFGTSATTRRTIVP